MPNIASILKEEITRIARKEIRTEIASLRKVVSSHRSDIAELKRRALAAEKELSAIQKLLSKSRGPAAESSETNSPTTAPRFSAKAIATNRARLGLSAERFGKLVGVGGQSIYNWEAGTAYPSERYLSAIAQLKSIGKKEAMARLEEA
ncbi:MAG: helix-turn-helix domain-containing protein [Rhizobacter sp.]|nr:helix-turn-helix domain-containing protein [Rhizobacter sp.]